MKTYTREEAAKLTLDRTYGIHSTPDSVIVYESAAEVPPPAPVQADTRSEIEREIEASPALTALVGELAAQKGVTRDALVRSLAVKA